MEIVIGKVLQKLLKEKRLSVKELSRRSGVPSSTIHEWTGGRKPRDPVQIKKVANALGVSLNQILFGEADENESLNITQILKEDVFSGVFEINVKRVKVK